MPIALNAKAGVISDIEGLIQKAKQASRKSSTQTRRLLLIPLQNKFQKRVESNFRFWEAKYNKVALKAGPKLYRYGQTQIKKQIPNLPYLVKSVYDIPPAWDSTISAAIPLSTFPTQPLLSATTQHLDAAYNKSASLLSQQLGSQAAFQLRDPDILKSINTRANFMTSSVTNTTYTQLKHRLAVSYFVEGKHPTLPTKSPITGRLMTSVSQDIEQFFHGQVGRSKMVARTETAAIQSQAEYEYNGRVRITRHGWMYADAGARPEHRRNNGVVVNIGDRFPDGQLRVGEGPPELVINCRCSNYPVVSPGQTISPWGGEARGAAPVGGGAIRSTLTIAQWGRALAPPKKDLIRYYSRTGHEKINTALRVVGEGRLTPSAVKSSPELTKQIGMGKELDEILASAPKVKETAILYRGMSLSMNIRGNVKVYSNLVAGLKPGKVYSSSAFMSTSMDAYRAQKFTGLALESQKKIVFVIKKPKTGVDISKLAHHAAEKEVLFRPNTRFKVDSVKTITIEGRGEVLEVIVHEL